MLYIGIDPGIDGALAAIGDNVKTSTVMPIIKGEKGGTKSIINVRGIMDWLFKVAKTEMSAGIINAPTDEGLAELHFDFFTFERDLATVIKLVVLEKVGAMPKQGITSAFNFGKTFGMLQAIILTLGIPLQLVTPQAWKKTILEGTLKDKSAAIQYVQRRYPDVKLLATERCRVEHDGMAEAMCLAEYGLRLK